MYLSMNNLSGDNTGNGGSHCGRWQKDAGQRGAVTVTG